MNPLIGSFCLGLPANGDEDNVVYTGRVHISEERLEACHVMSPSAMQLGEALARQSALQGNILFESDVQISIKKKH